MGHEQRGLEQYALRPAKGVTLCMGLPGVVFAIAPHAAALSSEGSDSEVS